MAMQINLSGVLPIIVSGIVKNSERCRLNLVVINFALIYHFPKRITIKRFNQNNAKRIGKDLLKLSMDQKIRKPMLPTMTEN